MFTDDVLHVLLLQCLKESNSSVYIAPCNVVVTWWPLGRFQHYRVKCDPKKADEQIYTYTHYREKRIILVSASL